MKILNKCPVCGGKLEYSHLNQYANVYSIKSNGELSKRKRKEDIGSMDCGFISCTDCDFVTNCDLECESHKNIEILQINDKYYYDYDD